MEWLLFAAGLLLIAGTGFFVAVEFSLIALDQPTVQRAVAAVGLPDVAVASISLVLAMVLATLLSMLLGELVPKNMAIALSFPVGRALARPQLMFTAVFKPAIVVLNGFSNKVLNLFGLEAKEEISGARTPAELASLVRRSAAMGTLDAGTANFVARTLNFSTRTAADVMTPRIRVETIDADQPVSDILDAARRTGYSRFPVIGDSADDIRGLVHVKKAVAVPGERRPNLEAGAVMNPVVRVPETTH